jgi:hypothetical protein
MDHLHRPLQKQPLLSQTDTLWASFSYRIYESESKKHLDQMREKILLHFIALVFNQTFDCVLDFLRAWRQLVPAPHYRHPAVQVWIYQLHRANPVAVPKDVRDMDPADVTTRAVQFVRANQTPGKCTCRFTLCYLFASLFSMDVYMVDTHRANRTHVLACFRDQAVDALNVFSKTPEPQAGGKEEFFIYLAYDGVQFSLSLPERTVRGPASHHPWMSSDASTQHVKERDSPLKLVMCASDTVEHVSYFAQIQPATTCVYWAIVPAPQWGAGIYRILPASPRAPMAAPLYIFVSRGGQGDGFAMASYLDAEAAPAAFLLDPAKTRLVIVVEHENQTFAEQCLVEYFKL